MGYNSIVLSGTPVSGKSTLAKRLATHYEMERFSLGDLWRARYAKEGREGESFEAFYGRHPAEESRRMNDEAKRMFENGNYVGESRIISYLDPEKCLRIFVTADLEVRAERARGRDDYKNIDMAQVMRILKRREDDEARVSVELYGIDYRDPSTFELKIDTGAMSVDEEVALVRSLFDLKR